MAPHQEGACPHRERFVSWIYSRIVADTCHNSPPGGGQDDILGWTANCGERVAWYSGWIDREEQEPRSTTVAAKHAEKLAKAELNHGPPGPSEI